MPDSPIMSKKDDKHWTSLERRLTAIETGFDAFTKNIDQALREMRDQQQRTATVIERRGQTDWAVLFSIVTLIIVILGGFTSLLTGHQSEIVQLVAKRSTELSEINKERLEDVHEEVNARVERLELSVDRMKEDRWTKEDQRQFELLLKK